jgi:hypothetical protein
LPQKKSVKDRSDSQNDSTEAPWPRVPKIANADEFQQSVAVAQLAVKLCELMKVKSNIPLEKENLVPKEFLDQAWQLIQSAREHVLRPQSNAEYLAVHGSHDAAEKVVERILSASQVLFKRLCNSKRNKGDRETIVLSDVENGKPIEVEWRVYRSERGFDDLFRAYWTHNGEQWTEWMKGEKPRTPWMKRDAVTFWKLAHDEEKYPGGFNQLWKERGESVLASWKCDGVPAHDFLALARFRRESDKRAANLNKKPKRKRRRQLKAR